MEIYKVSDMVHNRRKLLESARNGGAIIERRETNGEVIEEFMLINDKYLRHSTGHGLQSIKDMQDN